MADVDLKIKIKSEYQNAGLDELKRALKENTAAMDEMKRSGQQGTSAWNEAKTRAQALTESIKETSREYKGLDANVKQSKFQLLEFGENLTVVIAGITAAVDGLIQLGKQLYDIGLKGAEFGNLKNHFQELNGGVEKSTEYLNQLKKAAAGSLNDADLIKYSNKMQDLGYSVEQTTQFMDLAETTSDNLGITIDEGTTKLLTFIETGRGKGLKDMGISIADVKAEMDKLAESQNIDIKNADEETQKRIRSDAVLKLYGKSLEEISKKEGDNADKLQSLSVAFENAKLKIGEVVGGVLKGLADLFGASAEKVAIFVTVLGGLIAALVTVGTTVKLLSVAFAALNVSTGGIMVALGALVTIAASVAFAFSSSSKSIKETSEEMLKSEAVNESTRKELEELNISANNMAEAYKGIEAAIYGMSEAQTKSAIKFVDAEIKKIEALKETSRQLDFNNMKAKGLEDYDIQNPTHQLQLQQAEEFTYGADLDKLNKLKEELNVKMSTFTQAENRGTDTGKQRIDNAKDEKVELDEIQKLQEEIKKLEADRLDLASKYGEQSEIVYQTDAKIIEDKRKINELEREHNAWVKSISDETGVIQDNYKERGSVDVADKIKNEQAAKNYEALKERIKKANEIISQSMAETTTAVGNLFGAFLKGDSSKDAFKQFLKTIVTTFINSVQALMFAAGGALYAKGITTFGISMIKDLPLYAAGWAALEIAKGVVGALAEGGDFKPGAYLVGERGPELMITGSSGHMVNNRDFNNMVLAGRQQNQSVNNILNLGVDVDWIKVRRATDLHYTKYKNSGRL